MSKPSAASTLKRFERIMRRLKLYLSKPKPLPPEPKPEWQIDDPRTIQWPPVKRSTK